MPRHVLDTPVLMDEIERDVRGAEGVDLVGRSAPYVAVHHLQLVTVNPLDSVQQIVSCLPQGGQVDPFVRIPVIPRDAMHLDAAVFAASDLVKSADNHPAVTHDAQRDASLILVAGVLDSHGMPQFKEVFLHRMVIVVDCLTDLGRELVKLFFRFHTFVIYFPSATCRALQLPLPGVVITPHPKMAARARQSEGSWKVLPAYGSL